MFKIAFLGAGSTVFAKNLMGDCIFTKELGEFDVALYDIDNERLQESTDLVTLLNNKYQGKAKIYSHCGVENRREALRDADFVINAIQVGGYEPATVRDFEIPKKYLLKQTIGDTLGVGGIFRALRTFPVLESFAEDIKAVCPNALVLNYTNPMAMLTGYMIRVLGLRAVGLCHSVQVCVPMLLEKVNIGLDTVGSYKIAGINHQAWLLEIKDKLGKDMYPEIKRLAKTPSCIAQIEKDSDITGRADLVRFKIMETFGYYNTESSEHTAEYSPYFIKNTYPQIIKDFKIPIDEYPRRCISQIEEWKKLRIDLQDSNNVTHVKSREYACRIINAVVNNKCDVIHGNVINNGLIPNLHDEACVEVPCLVDGSGITPCRIGDLPLQLAALNTTNILPQMLTIAAGVSKKRQDVYNAVMLDPHTSSELSIDDIIKMCDELLEAHSDFLPKYN